MPAQTCKTIIFEKFNPDADDLYTILSNADDPESDKLVEKINELSVANFAQFMEKFAPKVYEVCHSIDGNIRFSYYLDRDAVKNEYYVERSIAEQDYYKMLSRLYSEKGSSGKANLEFNDAEILDMLTPKQAVQTARDLRKKLEYNLKEYYKAEEKGENTTEFYEKITDCRRQIASQYSGTQSTLIPILIEDLKMKRRKLLTDQNLIASEDGSNVPQLEAGKSGELYIAADGTLQIAEPRSQSTALIAANAENTSAVAVHDIGAEIATVLEDDYDQNAPNQNDFVKSLVVSTYAPLSNLPTVKATTSLAIAEEVNKLELQINSLEEIYCKARENFINEVSKLIEKLMGVKVFFDHATVEGGEQSKLPEAVIIANCTASKLLGIEDKFRKFIKHRGKDQTDNRIWFAVLPNVMEQNLAGAPVKKQAKGPFGGPLGPIKPLKQNDEIDDEYTSVNAAIKFLDVMEEARVLTVMSIREKTGNTFGDLSVEEVHSKMERLPKDKAHGVYAYPNFTLTRERPGFKPFRPYNERTIALPGIYIDAAYPAVGLLVACQQTDYLERHGFRGRVCKENVCSRVDLESEEVKKNIRTKFNRELSLRWSENLRSTITKSMFGFAFCGDVIYDKGQPLKNAYVICARSLKRNEQGVYRPIYHTLMEDYVAMHLKNHVGTKLADVRKFVKNVVKGDWSTQYRRFSEDSPNLILMPGEDIYIDEERKKIVIHLSEEDSSVDDFEIVSDR